MKIATRPFFRIHDDKYNHMKRISQKELARQLNVSQAVISAVLNGSSTIRAGEDTRKKILEAVKESSYQPNRLANALLHRKTQTIGIIYQGGYSQLGVRKLAATVDRIRAREYLPLIYDLVLDVKGDEPCRLLADLNVNGIILINAGYPFMEETYPKFLKNKIKVISIDSPQEPSMPQIFSDRAQGFYTLTKHLLSRGCRDIALILNSPAGHEEEEYTSSQGLRKGATLALKEVGLRPVAIENYDSIADPAKDPRNPYHGGVVTVRRLLDRGCRPDAIICSNDAWAIGAMSECTRRGIRVPADMAVVGYNDDLQARYATSPLTTLAPAVDDMAEEAVRYATAEEPASRKKHRTILFPCTLVVRESCQFSPSSNSTRKQPQKNKP